MTFYYWPDDKLAKFITIIKEVPILWDRHHPQYRNQQKRDATWKKVSKEIGDANISALKTKIKSFRSNYRSECNKIARDPNYKPVWRFYKSLRFFDNLPTEDYEDEEVEASNTEHFRKRNSRFHRWSDEKTKECIQIYKSYPILWNKQDENYGNFRERQKVLGIIAAKLSCPIAVLKMKIKSVRCHFLAESKRMANEENYRPVWRFFRQLAFLDSVNDDGNENAVDNDFIDTYDENSVNEYDEKINISRIFWKEAKVLQLIEFIKISPQLWHRKHPDHMNKKQKDIILQNIAKEMETNAANIEHKYKTLRRQFRKHYIGTVNNKNYVPAWRYYKPLQFLIGEMDAIDDFATSVEYLESEFFCDDTLSSFVDTNETENEHLSETNEYNDHDDNAEDINDDDFCWESNDESSQNVDRNTPVNGKTKLVFWSDDTTIKFIKLLREYPTLWDREEVDFFNNHKRAEIYEQLALKMGSTIPIIKSKVKRVTAEFRAEYRRMQNHSEYKPVWKFFPYLRYLAADLLLDDEEDEVQEVNNRIGRLWDDEKTIKFLSLLKQKPILYDKNLRCTDLAKKDQIWYNIACELNDSIDVVRKKYKTLRQMCRLERLRKKQDPNYAHTWRFLPYAKFLCDAINNEEVAELDDIEFQDLRSEHVPSPSQQSIIKWSDKQVLEFINILKKFPILYNPKVQNYKSFHARNEAWRKISKALEIPESALQRKYRTMSAQYFVEFRKAYLDADYTPNWKFYTFLRFIPVNKESMSDSLPVEDIHNESTEYDDEYDGLEEAETCSMNYFDSSNEHSSDLVHDDTAVDNSSAIFSDMQTIQEDATMDAETEDATPKHHIQLVQDEYTAFAEYVANEMRNMKGNKLVELSFKSKIIRAVLEANDAMKQGS